MSSDKTGKVREVFKKIDKKDIKILCKYHFPKGVKPIDLQIYENADSLKHCVIGIGDTGIEIVEKIKKGKSNYLSLMADISHRNLNEVKAEHKLYLMGDAEDKEMLTVENRRSLSKFIRAHKRVYIVTRLDNELNMCKVVEKIVQHLKRLNREVVLIAIKPFSFELPPWRIERVEDILKSFEKYIAKLIIFDSESLLEIKEVYSLTMPECFDFLDQVIGLIIRGEYGYGDEMVTNISLFGVLNERSE